MDRMLKAVVVSSAILSLSACVTQNFEENNKPVVLNESSDNEIALTRISLGLGYLKMGNTTQAKFNLEKAKKYAPNNVQVYTAFAHYYESVGEDNLTIQSYEHALSLKPDDANTLNNYGVFLCRKERLQEAEIQFLKAIQVPTYLRVSESYENLALCQLEALNFEKTELYLGKAIAHSPSDGSVLYQMMRFQYAIGEYTTAQSYGKRFEKSSRRFTAEYLALAYKVFVKQGNMRTATNYATMLVKMYPNSWHAKQYLLNGLDSIEADDLAEQYQILVATKNEPVTPKKVVVLSPERKAPISFSKNKRIQHTNVSKQKSSSSINHTNEQSSRKRSQSITQINVDEPSLQEVSELALQQKPEKTSKRRVVLKAPRSQINQTTAASVAPSETIKSVQATDVLIAQISGDGSVSAEQETIDTLAGGVLETEVNDDDLLNDSELDAIIAEAEALLSEEDTALLNGVSQVTALDEEVSELSKRHKALMKQQKEKPTPILEKSSPLQGHEKVIATDNAFNEPDGELIEKTLKNKKVTIDSDRSADSKVAAKDILSVSSQNKANERNLLTKIQSEQEVSIVTTRDAETLAVNGDEVVYTSYEQLPQHKLVYGENLFTVSKQYNIHLHALKKWNDLSDNTVLQVGDIIYLADPSMIVTGTE